MKPPLPKSGFRLSRIVILVIAAWLGVLYYNRFHAIHNIVSGSSTGTVSSSTAVSTYRPNNAHTGQSTMRENAGTFGGIGGVGSGSRFSSFSAPAMPTREANNSIALIEAAAKGDRKQIETLLKNHMKVDSRDEHRRTPLIYAGWNGYQEAAAQLLAAGANVSLQDRDGYNAFDYAAGRGLVDMVSFLLKHTKTPDNKGYVEYATLTKAAFAGDPAQFPPGTGKLKSVNRISPEGQTPLHIAAGNGSLAVAEALVKRGADVNRSNNSNQTALHWAAWNNQTTTLEWLLNHGGDITKQDLAGDTALTLAAQNNSVETAKVLIEKGADKTAFNKQGKTARTIADDKGYRELTSLLSQ